MRGTKKYMYIVFGILAIIAVSVFVIGGCMSGWDFMKWLDSGDFVWAVLLIIIFVIIVSAIFLVSWINSK